MLMKCHKVKFNEPKLLFFQSQSLVFALSSSILTCLLKHLRHHHNNKNQSDYHYSTIKRWVPRHKGVIFALAS